MIDEIGTCTELVAQHSETPHISLLVVELAGDYFGRYIVQSTTESLPLTKLEYSY